MLKSLNKKKIKNYVRNTLLKEDDYKDLNLICVVKHGLIIKRYLYILQDYKFILFRDISKFVKMMANRQFSIV